MSGEANRETIKRILDERIAQDRQAIAEDPWCFALAELQSESTWDGQFLGELMIKAACSGAGRELGIVIDDTPALLVATQGQPVSVEAIVDADEHSPLLAVTDTPEVYSILSDESRALAVRFDADACRALIGAGLPSENDLGDSLAGLPALRYPVWVDEIPAAVQRLADSGYDTILRLPFTSGDPDEWFKNVLSSLQRVIEQEPLLVGGFERVTVQIDAHLESTSLLRHGAKVLGGGLQRELAEVVTDDKPISAWRMYCHESAPDTVVGVRLELDDRRFVLLADDGFPPWVDSGLPFLLRTRTPLSALSEPEIAALAHLVVQAVGDCATSGEVEMGYLAWLLVTSLDGVLCLVSPKLIQEVRRGLNELAWIPTIDGGLASPLGLVPADHETLHAMTDAFGLDHVTRKTGLQVPDPAMEDPVYDYIYDCRPDPEGAFWDAVGKVMGRQCRHIFGGPAGLDKLRSTLRFAGRLARDFKEDGL